MKKFLDDVITFENSLTLENVFYLIVISFLFSLILTRIAVVITNKIGFVSKPNPIVQSHTKPVSYGGGIVIGVITLFFFSIFSYFNLLHIRFILGILPIFLIGTFDDIFNFSTAIKFLLELLSLTLYLFFININLFLIPLLAVFLLVAQNSWNLVDVMDGLLGWISITSFFTIGLILLIISPNFFSLSLICFTVSASTAGFLVWNSYPAKIYLGDAGSLFLGMLWGIVITEIFIWDIKLGLLCIFTGIIPIFEILFLIWARTKKGIPVYNKSPDHFSLRLLNNGFNIPKIISKVKLVNTFISLLCLTVGIIGISWISLSILISINLILFISTFYFLSSLKVYEVRKGK